MRFRSLAVSRASSMTEDDRNDCGALPVSAAHRGIVRCCGRPHGRVSAEGKWSPSSAPVQGGNVRKRVNEKGRCNLRFAKRTSGAINARTEGDTACGEEEHRVGRGVKPDLGDAGKLRAAEHAATPAADVGGRGGQRARARAL